MLAQMLREEGVQVEYTPPEERRDLAGAAQGVIVSLVSMGTGVAIKAGIDKFRKRMPRAKIKIETEDGHLIDADED
jgi:hypothetical protein